MGKRGARGNANASGAGATGRSGPQGRAAPQGRAPQGRAARQRRRGPQRRTGRSRLLLLAGSLIAVTLLGGVALAQWPGGDSSATEPGNIAASPMEEQPPLPVDTAPVKPSASPKPSPSDSPKAGDVPRSGPGTFTTAQASGKVVGTGGPLRRYQVQVEDGSGVSAKQAAVDIQAILSDPRSWAAHGKGRFQLVASGADVVIKIATPRTTDKLCASVGDTGGELNCEVAGGVVVNLKRWVTGSPQYDGPPAEYRHLIINHEIGHLIGYHQHMACPGAGKPAPVMMQQIKGLNGCTSNAWPYTAAGTFITGPSVP
ncbi:DUF3152 domain-containing protein [Streptomyces sp. NBC_00083]|uniref:DUF3152 domain-containing protein n=1 Tax=Streptomyces sp. NBC_00083 TaxID=2975647 RepID=UPI00224E2C59|nr:DUF3152 domain-containing protein [Streptomyces sp. NBC_00083]MCX5388104.1 DUF3152 domain-containing protein [Streptomyces sp. NBC_00083]